MKVASLAVVSLLNGVSANPWKNKTLGSVIFDFHAPDSLVKLAGELDTYKTEAEEATKKLVGCEDKCKLKKNPKMTTDEIKADCANY